jgi:hypothetical protein
MSQQPQPQQQVRAAGMSRTATDVSDGKRGETTQSQAVPALVGSTSSLQASGPARSSRTAARTELVDAASTRALPERKRTIDLKMEEPMDGGLEEEDGDEGFADEGDDFDDELFDDEDELVSPTFDEEDGEPLDDQNDFEGDEEDDDLEEEDAEERAMRLLGSEDMPEDERTELRMALWADAMFEVDNVQCVDESTPSACDGSRAQAAASLLAKGDKTQLTEGTGDAKENKQSLTDGSAAVLASSPPPLSAATATETSTSSSSAQPIAPAASAEPDDVWDDNNSVPLATASQSQQQEVGQDQQEQQQLMVYDTEMDSATGGSITQGQVIDEQSAMDESMTFSPDDQQSGQQGELLRQPGPAAFAGMSFDDSEW